jgi:SAM-dependent methyltransferase
VTSNSGLATPALFDELADVYDQFTSCLKSPESPVDQWIEAKLPGGGRALDVGCGAGRYTELLAEHCTDVLAIDPAPAMIELARRRRTRPNVTYQVRGLFDVQPVHDGLFDTVFAFSCVLHIGSPARVLRQLRSLVAPGGRLLVVEPERPATWSQDGWQVDLAFGSARAVHQASGDVEAAVSALRLFLAPAWQAISELSVPMTRDEFQRVYTEALPGVSIDDGLVAAGALAACWQPRQPVDSVR